MRYASHGGVLLDLVETASDFINRHDFFHRHVLVDGRQNPVVVFDVELVMRLHQLHIRAEPPRFMHEGEAFAG